MAKKKEPSNNSRRKFLKEVGTGIVGAYVAAPSIKVNAQNIKEEILDSINQKVNLSITVNGKKYNSKVTANTTLAEFIREEINLSGTKLVCNQGECGSCTVILNGQPIYSCHFLALDADGGEVLTIEGLLNGDELHPVQQSFIDEDGLQCGFCTPGQIMSAYAILKNNPNANDEEIQKGMSGNLCRCGAYPKILDSVKLALKKKI